ncbi:MAG: type I-MYXAN CRISPR-associated endonuclease Cas1 [Chloroflexi bacterium]|nr:type I-MYXAN CRISPR-associated endonuclease Cas1 [Chloroflexota bacterium]
MSQSSPGGEKPSHGPDPESPSSDRPVGGRPVPTDRTDTTSDGAHTPSAEDDLHEPPLRVMALHALAYCERLFYLEEVEELRVADANVFAGRDLHEVLGQEDPSQTEQRNFDVADARLGLIGRIDAFRRRDGAWTPYEHKRGQSARGHGGGHDAWETDRQQVGAYAMLLEAETGERVLEGRVRYHASGVTVRVAIDDALRASVGLAIDRGRELRRNLRRPPVTSNPRLCIRCSLAPVCLPEEERLERDPDREPLRLFPAHVDGQVLHVMTHDARVGRSGETLVVKRGEEPEAIFPIREVHALVIHGYAQVTTAAIHLCAAHDVPVHWLTTGGRYIAGISDGSFAVQRRLRQYSALTDARFAHELAKRVVAARIEGQLRFLLRATRGTDGKRAGRERIAEEVGIMRAQLRAIADAESTDVLRGHEGRAARSYFAGLPFVLGQSIDDRLRPQGRNRRPPRDRFNAALSFSYALLYRVVAQAIRSVGLEPAIGFYHTARSASPPLVLDVMEIFRVTLCDLPLVGSINRRQWDADRDFIVSKDHVWLSETGKRLAIELFESRLEEQWKHPVLDYSLSYARTVELEVRLLEKEWTSEGGLFARARLR